jgi:Mg2+/Co2+ transporter CorC
MNASQMTFGVEIETVAPQSAIELDGLRFEVLRADARQVHVLLVEKLPERLFGEPN